MCIDAYKLGIKEVIVPYENRNEAGTVKGLTVYPARNLNEVIKHLNEIKKIEKINVDVDEIFHKMNNYNVDFSEVKGQENAKRALEISAAGGHNCLLIGSPRIWKNNACKAHTYYFTRFII